ncbi:MAG: hypothetical protein CMC70_09340 [Flavobacteriaceae bacterium]|nr:hypothetical protein [Flavobacteriaceae bacterium]
MKVVCKGCACFYFLSFNVQNKLTYLLYLLTTISVAQNPTTYTTKDGLSSNFVYDITQDTKGFVWFATNRGISKFDGDTFTNFTTAEGLPNNDTWKLEADKQGRIWYASKSKRQGYIEKDSVYSYANEQNTVLSPVLYKTESHMHYSSDFIYELKNGTWTKVMDPSLLNLKIDSIENKTGDNQLAFPITSEKNIIINTEGINLVDSNLNPLKKTLPVILPINNYSLYRISNASHGYKNTFVGVFFNSILLYNHNKHSYTLFKFDELAQKINLAEDSSNIRFLTNEIQVKVGSFLFIFNYEYQLIHKVQVSEKKPNAIFQDIYGNIWVGSGSGISLYTSEYTSCNTYFKGKVTKHIGILNNKIYVGIFKDAFYEFDEAKKSTTLRLPLQESVYDIEDLSPHPTSFLLGGKKYYVSSVGSASPTLNEKKYPDTDNYDLAILKDIVTYKDTFYLGVTSKSVTKINQDITKAHSIAYKIGLLQIEGVGNSIFLGGSDGLHKFENGSVQKITGENPVVDVSILRLKNNNDTLYVGTDGNGLYTYATNTATHLPETKGLSVKEIIKIKDTLWLATDKGVKKLLIHPSDISKSKLIDQFFDTDGLLDTNVNDILIKGNKLFVTTDVGMSELHTNAAIYKKTPQLYFKHKKDTIQQIYSEANDVSVSFGAIDYSNSNNLQFSYRLVPNQTQWTETATKAVTFSNLLPGTYTLQIKATNQHFKTGTAQLSINIKPLWWQTMWATIVFWLAGILALLLLIILLKRTIKKNEQKRSERDKRVAGLELQALRSQMNPHFVHNSLNAIQYYIQRNEVELSENYLSKFSKLIRLFFEYSRRENITLQEEIELLKHYLSIEKMRFEDKLTYEIIIDQKLDIEEQNIPSMILQPLIENAVNHGIFHKTEKGTISLTFLAIKNGYKIVVEDDGVGINKAKEIYKASSKNYQSKSSAVLQERLELLKQSKDWFITHTIQDRSDISNDSGTRVTLTFIKPNL